MKYRTYGVVAAAGILFGAVTTTALGAFAANSSTNMNAGDTMNVGCAGPSLSWSQSDATDGVLSCADNPTTTTTPTTSPPTTTGGGTGSVGLDWSSFGHNPSTGSVSVTGQPVKAGTLLVFTAAADGCCQSLANVSGGGLTWTLVGRANSAAGDAEVWSAVASSAQAAFTVTATEHTTHEASQAGLLEFSSSGGVPAVTSQAGASGGSGAPTVTVTPAAYQLAVGDDFDSPTPRIASAGQTLLDQFDPNLPGTSVASFWVQASPTGTISDTAPINDQWNMEGVAIGASGSGGGSTTTTPPTTTPPTTTPPTTTPPTTTPPTTTPPTTTSTTVPPGGGGTACVITNTTNGGDNGQCNYNSVPYITGITSGPWVGANVWSGDPNYKFSLTSYAPNSWSTTVNVNTNFGGVESYSNTGWGSENTGDNATVDSFPTTTSSWSVTMPTDDTKVAGWAGYDLWFNDWADEVMIQPDITANSFYNCDAVAETTFNGTPWHLCVFGSERVWKIGPSDASPNPYNQASGSVDVKAMLDYMMAHGYLPANSKWTGGSFGFEICDTEGTQQTFAVNNFSWTQQ